MPVHTTMTLPSSRWTRITEEAVGPITFQNTGRTAVRVAVRAGEPPQTLEGSLLYAPGQGERHVALTELAPGAVAPSALYACPIALGGGELFVSYGAPVTEPSEAPADDSGAETTEEEGMLERFPGAAAAYSLRALSTAVEAVIRLRRSSDDVEQDFTAQALTDGTLLDWVGGADARVVTWYDQSGNGVHVSQTVPDEQPKLVEAGVLVELNERPAIAFDGSTEGLSDTEAMIAVSTRDFAYYAVAGYEQVNNWAGHAFGSFNAGDGLIPGYVHESGNVRIAIDALYAEPEPGVSVLDGVQRVIRLEGKRDAEATWGIEGSDYSVDISSRSESMLVFRGVGIFHTLGSSGRYLKGKAQEIIFYAKDQSAHREALTDALTTHYAGETAAVSDTSEEAEAIDPALALAIENEDYGAPVVGGFYAGVIDTTQQNIESRDAYQQGLRYAVIVSPQTYQADGYTQAAEGLPTGQLAWDTQDGPQEAACLTRWDGLSATNAMLAKDTSRFESFGYIDTLRNQYPAPATPGGSDWYLGALDETELLYRHLKPTAAQNVTGTAGVYTALFPESFQTGENPSSAPAGGAYQNDPMQPAQTDAPSFQEDQAQALNTSIYLTSTDAESEGLVWTVWFDHGTYPGRMVELGKDIPRAVRPIRRVVLPAA